MGEENLALLKYLLEHGARDITICDRKSREEVRAEIDEYESREGVKSRFGADYLDNLEKFDIVFRTPGLPYSDKKIQNGKNKNLEISSQTKLFFDLCPSPIIGITGTKGKGTTTALIGEILKRAGKKVFVGGNIGNAPIEFLDQLGANDIVVLELSSFQLQDLEKSPHIAVVLDIKIDHLDVHKDEAEYIDAKRNIVRHQDEKDFAVINADYLTSADFASSTLGKTYWFSRRKSVDLGAYVIDEQIILRDENGQYPIIKKDEIQLRGLHNLENIAAAITAAYIAGADIESIKTAVRSFKGLEHRLELVGEYNGVKFYNDSFSTTPDTTIAAIKSFSEPIILLLGGSEKNADYSELARVIASSAVKQIIPIGLTAGRIINDIENEKIKIDDKVQSMPEAVKHAKENAKPGDIVLLSPASASFDRFKNYKERGNIFKKEVGG